MGTDEPTEAPLGIDPVASRRIFLGMLALLAGGAMAFGVFRRGAGPPPAAIAGDPLLVEGREVYLSRCVSCHGEAGRGDGPIAKGLAGPPASGSHVEPSERTILVGMTQTGISAPWLVEGSAPTIT